MTEGEYLVSFDSDGSVKIWTHGWEEIDLLPEVSDIIMRHLGTIPTTTRKMLGRIIENKNPLDDIDWSWVIFQVNTDGINTLGGNCQNLKSVKKALLETEDEILDFIDWRNEQ
jgi:hypothetical protein